ncbi:hypothetical protein MCOR27_002513 [Pyricularia oryzae]|uniref:Initiation-specific alpha-1,6-mannosyltransferase n=3 Tax=Pyricularia TaxID=48558 RepID=A0ABQ8N791_PYRGI|nr:initiation-specific alpha-1,6-mannosyltransferase [Pyricularia oryzae 70-15]KAH8847905.1 hypothetical protein MCOR01_001298 [Pyricularia oryzae]KAI6292083.1 hypothetical protein MCOR33_010142 [Pyricularia grisea]EHA52708.1 initiation-specific alpha-1,6-mannosyltransferase [Pyricularia oryzae 70-15]KAH9430156.1 hypothetical protein MCOR02_009878 [Pyricularia oryzae]KAI6252575.1 hypothetical protein MCOR19_010825 [Pyricularia oryzae]
MAFWKEMAIGVADGNTMSTLLDQATQTISRPRYRKGLLTVLALTVLSTVWLYGTAIVQRTGQLVKHVNHSFRGPRYHSTWDDAYGVKSHADHLIPPNIWQIMLPKAWGDDTPVNTDTLKETATWLAMNRDYRYTLVGEDGGKGFVKHHFGDNETIVSLFNSLPNVGMKSDLLRYMLLYVEGGVYTDTDTVALKPIDQWVPRTFRNQTKLVVGIEFDQLDGGRWADIPHTIQFCQWTIAAAPRHPVFQMMISRIIESWEYLKREHNPDGQNPTWNPSNFEVLNSTGPAAWTDVVWEYLQTTDDSLTDLRNLSSLGPPRLFRDALVLPIDGFGMGQRHSGSTNDGSVPEGALVRHLFGGSWRGD